MDIIKQISNFFTVQDDSFEVQEIARIGIRGITAMAYHSSQSLIAIGTCTGDCYILGKVIDKEIQKLTEFPIKKLAFKEQLLIGLVDSQILLWNLQNQELSMAVPFPEPILDLEIQDSSWLVIAFQSGKVNLMDCFSTRMSHYCIPIDLGLGFQLLGIRSNPTDLNQLLLAFENESIVWDFEQSRPVERYPYNSKATGLAWKPDGVYLAISYGDGTLAFYTTKKTFFKKKSKMKPVHLVELGLKSKCSIRWIQEEGDVTRLYVASEKQIVYYEIQGERFEKAKKVIIPTEFDIIDTLYVRDCSLPLLLVWGLGFQAYHPHDLTKEPILPPSLLLSTKEAHQTSSLSHDGFLFISTVGSEQKHFLQGGTVYPSNTVRNYHLLVMSRKKTLEFWHLSIPYPKFVTSVEWDGFDLSGATLDFTQSKSHLFIVHEKLVVMLYFSKPVNVDELFEELDLTMAQMKQDSNDIKNLMGVMKIENGSEVEVKVVKPELEQLVSAKVDLESVDLNTDPESKQSKQNSVEELPESISSDVVVQVVTKEPAVEESVPVAVDHDEKENGEELKSEPKVVTETPSESDSKPSDSPLPDPHQFKRTTSLQNYLAATINSNTPFYVKDPLWSVPIQIEHDEPVVSFAYSAKLNLLATATAHHVYITNLKTQEFIFHRKLSQVRFYIGREDLKDVATVTKVVFSTFMGQVPVPCLIICTTQSLFVFDISNRGKITVIPCMGYHADFEFGNVIQFITLSDQCSIIDELNISELEKVYHLLVSPTTIFSLRGVQGSIQLVKNKSMGEEIVVQAGITTIQNQTKLVVISSTCITVFDVPSLTITFQVLLSEFKNISKQRLPEAFVSDHGVLGLWDVDDVLKMYSLHPNEPIPQYESKIHDQSKTKKQRMVRNATADDLFAPKPQTLAGELAQVGQKLQERGEKLNEIHEKAGDLENASKEFVETMKEYNRAQANKKWWQL